MVGILRGKLFNVQPRLPKLPIAVCLLSMSLFCSVENVAGHQDEPDEVTLEDYTHLIHRYRQGDCRDASRSLSRWDKEQIREAVHESRKERLDSGQIKAAALLHTEIVLLKFDDSDFHLNHARTWIRELDPPDREDFERRWLLMLGYFHMQSFGSGDTTAIHAARKSFPNDVELHTAFGMLSEASGWMERDASAFGIAETQYRIALETEPDHAEALIRLGRVLALTGQAEEAFDYLTRGLEGAPDPPVRLAGLLSLGEVHLGRGELAEAIQTFRRARALDPTCQTSVMALAMALHKAGDAQGSRRIIRDYLMPESEPPTSPATSGKHDLWWRYLLGNADRYETLLAELREETRL